MYLPADEVAPIFFGFSSDRRRSGEIERLAEAP
jgi:hypothetical protein